MNRLQALALGKAASLRTYRRLARDVTDPTLQVVLALLAREAEQPCTLIARLVNGALDALTRESIAEVLSGGWHADGQAIDIEAVVSTLHARSSRERRSARELHDLVSCEHEVGDDAICLLLDCIACDSDKHVRGVNSLAHRLEVRRARFARVHQQPGADPGLRSAM